MQKVLIITRSFPPCNKTASYRVLSFAKHLSKYGYFPVIVTRNWDRELVNEDDINFPSGNEIKHEKNELYEVYYIPFKGILSRRFNIQNRILKKIILLFEIYFGNRDIFNPHFGVFKFSSKLLKENEDITKLIVSAPPFDLLKYGNMLSKRHKIKWIADYRDEWTSDGSILLQKGTGPANLLSKILYNYYLSPEAVRKQEIEFTKSCSFFTTVSDSAISAISAITNKSGRLLINGFDQEDYDENVKPKLFEKFTITYAGWLYNSQQIEILCEAIKKLVERIPDLKLKLLFIGGKSFSGMEERLGKLMAGYENYIELTDRVSKRESIEMQQKSHLLLLSSHKGKDGIPSSKLYEYIGTKKAILLCPSDNGVIEDTLLKTQQGIICNTVEDTYNELLKLYNEFMMENRAVKSAINLNEVENYSRINQVKLLSEYLNEL